MGTSNTLTDTTQGELQTYQNHYLNSGIHIAVIGLGMITGTTGSLSTSEILTSESIATNTTGKITNVWKGEYKSNQQIFSTESEQEPEIGYQLKKLDLVRKLQSFQYLENNWNGYGALPIPEDVVRNATNLLFDLQSLPQVFPTGRESVQLEFENFETDDYLEIEVFKDKIVAFSIINDEEKEPYSVDNINDLNKTISLINVT